MKWEKRKNTDKTKNKITTDKQYINTGTKNTNNKKKQNDQLNQIESRGTLY